MGKTKNEIKTWMNQLAFYFATLLFVTLKIKSIFVEDHRPKSILSNH